jgi:regulator of protease activity HflC (stomatin/prohibitin superfamily)
MAPRIADQWERAIVLPLGRYTGSRGPGLFWIVPFIDTVTAWIDQRTITTSFDAEQTLTSDTVPVNVDAVLFWVVHDPGARRSRSCFAGESVLKLNCSTSSTSDPIRGALRCSP